MNRRPTNVKKDHRIFKETANKTKSFNISPRQGIRGGIRL